MLFEPLSFIILLLFLLVLSLVLLFWFAVTLGSRPQMSVVKAKKIAANAENANAEKKVLKPEKPALKPEIGVAEKAQPEHAKAQSKLKVEPVAEFKIDRRTANEARLRLSNDQVRGLHAKATRVATTSAGEVPVLEPPPSPPKPKPEEDAFERFIRSKNDEMEF